MGDEVINLGKYEISINARGNPWICKDCGEGMEISSPETIAKLEALLDKFWNENF